MKKIVGLEVRQVESQGDSVRVEPDPSFAMEQALELAFYLLFDGHGGTRVVNT
jgi:serine/threonine protein phosphatase PrpC